MKPEEVLEEILLLDEAERARLFELIRRRPALKHHLEARAEPATPAEEVPAPDTDADYLIIWDGGSRGNPGAGYGSYQLTSVKNGKSRVEKLEFRDQMTNNEAEYETLINALDTLAGKIRERNRDPGQYSVEVRGDSMLVVNQLLGKWKAKDARMAAYRDRARTLLRQFGRFTVRHHDRRYSVEALGH